VSPRRVVYWPEKVIDHCCGPGGGARLGKRCVPMVGPPWPAPSLLGCCDCACAADAIAMRLPATAAAICQRAKLRLLFPCITSWGPFSRRARPEHITPPPPPPKRQMVRTQPLWRTSESDKSRKALRLRVFHRDRGAMSRANEEPWRWPRV